MASNLIPISSYNSLLNTNNLLTNKLSTISFPKLTNILSFNNNASQSYALTLGNNASEQAIRSVAQKLLIPASTTTKQTSYQPSSKETSNIKITNNSYTSQWKPQTSTSPQTTSISSKNTLNQSTNSAYVANRILSGNARLTDSVNRTDNITQTRTENKAISKQSNVQARTDTISVKEQQVINTNKNSYITTQTQQYGPKGQLIGGVQTHNDNKKINEVETIDRNTSIKATQTTKPGDPLEKNHYAINTQIKDTKATTGSVVHEGLRLPSDIIKDNVTTTSNESATMDVALKSYSLNLGPNGTLGGGWGNNITTVRKGTIETKTTGTVNNPLPADNVLSPQYNSPFASTPVTSQSKTNYTVTSNATTDIKTGGPTVIQDFKGTNLVQSQTNEVDKVGKNGQVTLNVNTNTQEATNINGKVEIKDTGASNQPALYLKITEGDLYKDVGNVDPQTGLRGDYRISQGEMKFDFTMEKSKLTQQNSVTTELNKVKGTEVSATTNEETVRLTGSIVASEDANHNKIYTLKATVADNTEDVTVQNANNKSGVQVDKSNKAYELNGTFVLSQDPNVKPTLNINTVKKSEVNQSTAVNMNNDTNPDANGMIAGLSMDQNGALNFNFGAYNFSFKASNSGQIAA